MYNYIEWGIFMAVFKCKMCGGDLEIIEGRSVAECQYCGSVQTLPKLDDEKRANLYDRANHFRRNNEYDKAMAIYEQILNEEPTDAEAYWSVVLCKYGIEYVEDPKNHKRIPTVNRAQFTSVSADEDFKSALKYADTEQKKIYKAEAKVVDDIQKGILEISQKEEPFDVFICYKETDNNGRRTPDSVLATELYHELTKEGFKVFFSRITLEDKLGTAYEPYIFAALNSSKAMVVLGTKSEYFNAVWVKNEWSRYLALIKNGAKKTLIPAYRDMDPYDLPEEFSHLQAQDMSKLGFMQDLIRGIKKIVDVDEPKQIFKENTFANATLSVSANIIALKKRGFMALEDGEWQKADEFFEEALNQDAEDAECYLGKLMAELKVIKQEQLANCEQPFDENGNYQKAIRFADKQLAEKIKGYVERINNRNEENRIKSIYYDAVSKQENANTESDYLEAAECFKSIIEYKDSKILFEKCLESAKLEAEERHVVEEKAAKKRKKAFAIGTPIVAACIAFLIILTTVIIPSGKYNSAMELYNAGKYQDAYTAFNEVSYKDSKDKASECLFLLQKSNLTDIKKGDTVKFGFYEQDNNTTNGKEEIEWIVLNVEGSKALVISKYALDCQQYNTSYTDVTWESCSLRKWMNNTFINEAFGSKHQELIPSVSVSADKNPNNSTNPGNATTDKVFLFSITEAKKYFSSDSARKCKPTKYAIANGAYVNSDNGNCWWWLRSPGDYQSNAADVNYVGSFFYYGSGVNYDRSCVRPAMWISLDK